MGFEARKAGGYEDPDKIPVITRWTVHARGIRKGCHAFRKYHNGMLSGQWTTNPHLTRTHRIVVRAMKTFFLLLFFSKTLLLTPDPINLSQDWMQIVPQRPLTAITSGATIIIDITSIVGEEKNIATLERTFPRGTVEAKLIRDDGTEVTLHDGFFAYSEHQCWILLSGDGPVPTSVRFVKVLVRGSPILRGVKVSWKNFQL